MAKKCPITLNNGAVTCVMYGDIEVQLPPIEDRNVAELNVECKDGVFTIVEEEKEKPEKEEAKVEDKKQDVKADSKPDYAHGNKSYFKGNK